VSRTRKTGAGRPAPLKRVQRSVWVNGMRTTIILEAAFWAAIDAAAAEMDMATAELCQQIGTEARAGGEAMNQALRLWAISYHRDKWVREGR